MSFEEFLMAKEAVATGFLGFITLLVYLAYHGAKSVMKDHCKNATHLTIRHEHVFDKPVPVMIVKSEAIEEYDTPEGAVRREYVIIRQDEGIQ